MRRALLVLALALAGSAEACDGGCTCSEGGARMSCAGAGLGAPPALHRRLLVLDLSGNNISTLEPDAFAGAPALRDLELSDNELRAVSSGALRLAALARLALAGCGLRAVPPLAGLPALTHLSLERNELSELTGDSLSAPTALRWLRLDHNRLRRVPRDALLPLRRLQLLSLADNLLEELPPDSLPALPDLHTLVLRHNRLHTLHAGALAALPALRVLHVEHNRLTELAAALEAPRLEELWAGHNRMGALTADPTAPAAPRLRRLDLRHNPLRSSPHAPLVQAPALTTLVLSECRSLSALPALNGSSRLETLRADRCGLRLLPRALCQLAPRLRTLDVRDNELSDLPELSECGDLRVLDASSNRLQSGVGAALRGLARLHDLQLAHNRLRELDADAFRHTPALRSLDLEDNLLEYIDSEAFLPITRLEDLNVGNNVFPQLPAAGLRHLLHLKTHNNPNLRRFHPPEAFPRIQTLVLSYAYHCCEFLPAEDEGGGARTLTDFVLVPARDTDAAAWANASDLWPLVANATGGARLRELLAAWGSASPLGGARARAVRCAPAPGPFLPCADLFDWWTLRCGVWAVFLLALLGNGTVLFVLVFSRGRTDVPRFLVANLAAADLCMAVYLGLLAVVDAGTLGEFRAHAVAWQLSPACRLAGFLGVLSTELSIYTLAVITLERNYAITHAMHLNKRLSLRHAGAAMAAGWAGSLLAAALPLAGVSDYRKFAVCLPFETGSPSALAYVAALPVVNGLAFLVLLGCYLKMYCAIRGSQAWNSNDSRIARRMALLVFTDFLCWSPVAFFALTAAFGARLVSPEQAKVLTVFVLPLNSCCNPFLYAILTKQFKKDCALVCKAIEESRVTRGIGRCRHSSNFSNRQTPAATGSLGGSSRGPAPCVCRRLLPPAPAPRPRRLLRWLWPAPAASASTSADFSSSRSDSWRRGAGGASAGAARGGRGGAWPAARKTSQDSNLSSSRNDSSGSAATASTGTWRTPAPPRPRAARPRLTRQPAVLADEPPAHPAARLHTIPSAAEEPA